MNKLKIITLASILVTFVSGTIFSYFSSIYSYSCRYYSCQKDMLSLLYQNRSLFFVLTVFGNIVWIIAAFHLRKKLKKWSFLYWVGLLTLISFFAFQGFFSYYNNPVTIWCTWLLDIDMDRSSCASNGGLITIFVRNVGTITACAPINITVTYGNNSPLNCTAINSISPGEETSATCTRTGVAGYYNVSIVSSYSRVRGSIYCPS